MNEELRFEEGYEAENNEANNNSEEATVNSGGGKLGGMLFGGALVAAAGGLGYLWANKGKIKEKQEQRKYAKLEKKAAKMGYALASIPAEAEDESTENDESKEENK